MQLIEKGCIIIFGFFVYPFKYRVSYFRKFKMMNAPVFRGIFFNHRINKQLLLYVVKRRGTSDYNLNAVSSAGKLLSSLNAGLPDTILDIKNAKMPVCKVHRFPVILFILNNLEMK